ncbi:MAG TPA: Uma2 family endonuclease [Actinomycetales bacterium]|nr:Uma2 family endonuclease [Actinomycetales bacterium]
MTASPQAPRHLLTIEEFQRLPEDDQGRTELQEGALIVTPSPTPRHMVVCAELYGLISRVLPEGYRAVPDVDLDLQLAPASSPGWSRRPDLVVVTQESFARVNRDGGLLSASDALLVLEIVSPGLRRTDHVIKRSEYADAGIQHYWIIDLGDEGEPTTLTVCHLAEGFGYQDGGALAGRVELTEPFAVRLDLEALVDG